LQREEINQSVIKEMHKEPRIYPEGDDSEIPAFSVTHIRPLTGDSSTPKP
jgi:hypothetical protein